MTPRSDRVGKPPNGLKTQREPSATGSLIRLIVLESTAYVDCLKTGMPPWQRRVRDPIPTCRIPR